MLVDVLGSLSHAGEVVEAGVDVARQVEHVPAVDHDVRLLLRYVADDICLCVIQPV